MKATLKAGIAKSLQSEADGSPRHQQLLRGTLSSEPRNKLPRNSTGCNYHVQVYDVGIFALKAAGQCQCAYHLSLEPLLTADPFYLLRRGLASRWLTTDTEEDAMWELLQRLCMHGRSDRIGIPGASTNRPRQPTSQQDLWEVFADMLKGIVRYTALFCTICNFMLKKIADHPPLVSAHSITSQSIRQPRKFRVATSRAEARTQVHTAFPSAVQSGASGEILERSMGELRQAICTGRLSIGAATPDDGFNSSLLDQHARQLAANEGITDIPSSSSIQQLGSLLRQAHEEGLVLRQQMSTDLPSWECTVQERSEAHVKVSSEVFMTLEAKYMPLVIQLAGLEPHKKELCTTMIAVLLHVLLSTAICGGELSYQLHHWPFQPFCNWNLMEIGGR